MRAISLLISLILTLAILAFVLLNVSNVITMENAFIQLKVNVGFLILFIALSGGIITICLGVAFGISSKSKTKELKKKVEDQKLKGEIESDRVKQLEAKIKTLEEALDMATKLN